MKNRLLIITFFFTTTFSCCAQNPILWGFTHQGGKQNDGIILNYNIITNIETDKHDFIGSPNDGVFPISALIKANNGLLYGMTQEGGANNAGTIFNYNINTGTETDIYDFGNGTNGVGPRGLLIQASDSLLYGMTQDGGTYGVGILFSYNILKGVETDLHNFGSGTDGQNPLGSLIQASNGLIYGVVGNGGTYGGGIIFSYNISNGNYIDVHDFGDGTDGGYPEGSLIQISDSLLYGLTESGGINGFGTIFSYNISTEVESDTYDFGGFDGKYPLYGKLLQASDSLLYGMTQQGGTNNEGIIFSYNIYTSIENDVHDFGNGTDGKIPVASLIQASNGLLYGMTQGGGANGGTNGDGIIFSYNITTGTETDIHDFGSGTDGKTPLGSLIEVDTIGVTPITSSICAGGSVTLKASGATTYTWSPATGLSATTGDSVIATPTATTTYTITGVIGSTGTSYAQTDSTTVTVTVNTTPTITVNTPSPVCVGASAILSANGAATYTWAPSTGLNATTGDSVIASPIVTTTYTVTGMDSLGCSSTAIDSVKIISAPPLVISPQPPPSFCSGSSAELKISSEGSDFTWTPSTGLSATIGDSVIAGPTITTIYTITGTDSLGCTATGTEKVTVFPPPIIPTFTQDGNTLKSSAHYQNQWYLNGTLLVGDTLQYLTITIAGEYWVSVTNEANGCSSASDSADITTGINQLTVESGQVTVYPNPFSNTIFIKMNSSAVDVSDWSLQVIDVLGRMVYTKPSLNYANAIDLSNLPGGVYFIAVMNKTGTVVYPVVRQN